MTDTNKSSLDLVEQAVAAALIHWRNMSPDIMKAVLDQEIPAQMQRLTRQGHIHSSSMRPYSGSDWRYRQLLFVRLVPQGSIHCIELGVSSSGSIHIDAYEWEVVESLYMPILLRASEERGVS